MIAGKYRVMKKLGEGAMGSVWLAKNETTDREFAIKILQPDVAGAPEALARFFREAKICGSLRHPSILEIYDAGPAPELGNAPFLVMERLDGAPLDVIIRQRGAMRPRVAIDIVVQLSRGLELAHQKGIVHRDLKPANVFLHRPGTGALEPKVLDFGISKMVVDPGSPELALTNTAAILGSPLYMSPEQMDHGKGLDARSDVHALGLLLWELLVGTPPFAASSYNLLVIEIMRGPRPRLRDVMPSASDKLAEIVERAFAIDREERFQSAAALADALDDELTRLGGGVLASRTAATDVLSGLDLDSKAPPPMKHGSTTEPLSVDAIKQSPAARSVIGPPSLRSFAQTEEAAPLDTNPRVPMPVAAVSAQLPARSRALASPSTTSSSSGGSKLSVALAAVALIVLSVAGGGLWLAQKKGAAAAVQAPSDLPAPRGEPSASPLVSAEPAPTTSPVTPTASPTASASAAKLAPATMPPAAPAITVVKRVRPVASGATPAAPATTTSRPRIDQSGL